MEAEFALRPARLDDAAAITEIHLSVEGERIKSTGSLLERWKAGGPWMAVESCAAHLNHLLRTAGRYAFIAEVKGRPIGEVELYRSREAAPFGGLHLSILYVHRDYQRHRIGTRLLELAIDLARQLGVQQLTTQPETEAEDFYRRHGFRPWMELWEMQAEAKGQFWLPLRALAAYESPPEQLALRIGRYQCGAQAWDDLFPALHLPGWSDLPRRIWKTRLRGAPAILALRRQLNDPAQADGFAWLMPNEPLAPAIHALQALAAAEGYAAVDLLLPQEEAQLGRRKRALAYQTRLQLWHRPLSSEGGRERQLSTLPPQV